MVKVLHPLLRNNSQSQQGTKKSPATIRAHHLQNLLMLKAAATSLHLDKPSEDAVLDNSDVREEQRETNTGDVDS